MDEVRDIAVECTGVVFVDSCGIRVNANDLIYDLLQRLERIPYERDYNGAFAGRVKIEVELLGDMQGEKMQE